jgi:MFS family permease
MVKPIDNAFSNPVAENTTGHANEIQWPQLLSLAALYSSIIIGWIAYYNYQPILLQAYRFQNLSFLLIIAQGIILVVTPIIAGKFGDKYRFTKGHRIPIITAGISFAAMIFMAVAFTLISNPNDTFRWIFPFLIIFWLFGMSLFTSPALSTVELFTPIDKMPRAMAILTIASNLIYALEPVIVDIINTLGAPATFVLGGVLVSLSGYALKKNSLKLFKGTNEGVSTLEEKKKTSSSYGLILLSGIVVGVVTTVLFNLLPGSLYAQFSGPYSFLPEGKWILVAILALSAVLSLPASNVVTSIGVTRSFKITAISSLLTLMLLFFSGSLVVSVILLAVFVASFASLSVSALPLALNHAGFSQKVLCVGIFFSGVEIPNGILEIVLGY